MTPHPASRPSIRRATRVMGGVALAALVSVVLSACIPFSMFADATSTSTPDPSGAPAGFESYYNQPIVWEPCGNQVQCATISAPTVWNDPTSEPITLGLSRHLASIQPARGNIMVNPGGPGESAAMFVRDAVDRAVDPTLRDDFNIVGLDPRGVGESTPVTCYTDPKDMDKALYGIPRGERGSDQWNADISAAARDFGQACLTNTGPALQFFDTVSVARDMDMVRADMGDATLNYLGYSYGTFLGATYANIFPTRVGRMVLDGAVDPTATIDAGATGQTVGFESALNAYIAWCVDGGDCPLGSTVPEASTALSQLIADIDASPLPSSDGRILGADALITGLLSPLYDDTAWPYLTDIISGALAGDPTLAFEAADGYNGRNADGTYDNNSSNAFFAINCADTPPVDQNAPATTVTPEETAQLLIDAPILGPYMNSTVDGCADWPFPGRGSTDPIHAEGAPELLVIGTTNDPATPYDSAVSLTEQMSSAHLVTYDGEGHTAYNRGVTCINDIVDAYFLDGTLPPEGIICS